MTVMTVVQAINAALGQELARDKNVVLLGEDVGFEGGVFRATDGLQAKFGKDRVIDTPLAEENIIATSIGMAAAGLRPVAEIQFSGFVGVGFNHIANHMARLRYRSRGHVQMHMVIRAPHGGGIRALEHHCECIEATYGHIPGLTVVTPSNPYDAKGLLASSIRGNDPVIFLEPTRLYRAVKADIPDEEYTVPLGEAKIVQEGDKVTVVSWGPMMKNTITAAADALNAGISCEVIDLRTVSPMDQTGLITQSVQKTGRLVVVQEAPRAFGTAAEVIARVNDTAFDYLQAAPVRVTGYTTQLPLGTNEDFFIPDPTRILAGIKKAASY
jgi:pyruvate dehydrogenase E1 component beta subunit